MGFDGGRLTRHALAAALSLWGALAPAPGSAQDASGAVILSPYNSYRGVNNYARLRPHAGVDFAGRDGDPVLAAADGIVSRIIALPIGCGRAVVLEHPGFERWTVYCHMSAVAVSRGQSVRRGEQIGMIGTSGNAGNVPHVHLELCTTACVSHADGDLSGTRDPLEFAHGCFEAGQMYATDRLVITFPVACRYWTRGVE